MPRIEHLALWTADLDRAVAFYETVFGARAGARYDSRSRPLTSRFLSFEGGARLEIMTRPEAVGGASEPSVGIAHFAISVGSRAEVDRLSARLAEDGRSLVSGPRVTGDGYYESVVLDPDGNLVEITE